MDCPKCGHPNAGDSVCARCGVIFAKVREAPSRRVPAAVAPPNSPRRFWLVVGGIVIAVAALAALLRPPRKTATAETVAPREALQSAPAAIEVPVPAPSTTPETVAPPLTLPSVSGIAAQDVEMAKLLWSRAAGLPVAEADLRSAEDLMRRYPTEASLEALVETLLVRLGSQEVAAHRLDAAEGFLRRAVGMPRSALPSRLALLDLLLRKEQWSAVESLAREVLTINPRNPIALRALGYALVRQDRDREALEPLRAALALRDTADVRALVTRIEKGATVESGMTEQRIAHFNVRYDGDAHEDVGRDILAALERHRATLVTRFDHEPAVSIPVILFSRRAYYDASGAPAWSGGNYDGTDGRVRIPIGGLTAGLTPHVDATLIHELTHAFVADMSRGAAPREIHEGVAQYMEGKRLESLLDASQLKMLASGRAASVDAFYLQALSLSEYLYDQRGQGGINTLLSTMGETGNVNEAFRRVYGDDYAGVQKAWFARIRQLYGAN